MNRQEAQPAGDLTLRTLAMPADANAAGDIFGGWVMAQMDLAAGNVAARIQDLDLDKRSYGAGLRFHTRRLTVARLDVATGAEGWRWLFRLTDPLAFTRLERRASVVPSVP